MSIGWDEFEIILKGAAAAGGVLSFLWAVYQWRVNQEEHRLQAAIQAQKENEQKWLQLQKPFMERQLQLYSEAVHITAILATAPKGDNWESARKRFWELYWGELALVENKEVESRMVQFGNVLNSISNDDSATVLQSESLGLAHAIRRSIDQSWGLKIWTANQ
jgi:hypothetical protein